MKYNWPMNVCLVLEKETYNIIILFGRYLGQHMFIFLIIYFVVDLKL